MSSTDVKKKIWEARLKEQGHTPILNEDLFEYGEEEIDIFVTDIGFHNGPGCSVCGWTTCWNCQGVDSIPKCLGKG